MKVVLQLGPYPPPHGGVQTNLVAIREHLRFHGISAPVVNLTRHRRPDADDVYYPRNAFEVVKRLVALPADVVHLHLGGRLTPRLLGLCLFCTLLPRRRVVLTFHSGGYPSAVSARPLRPSSLRGFVFRRLDAVIAVNEEIAALFARLGVERRRIHTICPFSPVSLRDDITLPEDLRRFRAEHSPLLTTVGLLEPEYDLELQIEVLELVRRRFPGAGLVIVGSGSLDSQLQQRRQSSPVGAHVRLCGDVAHPITLRLITESDVFLRTTLYDGDSVSVREALQLGVPVIATDNGMRPHGVHLIPRSDPSALCGAIETVLTGPVDRARTTSSCEASLDRVLQLYSALIRGNATSRHPSAALP